MGVFPYSLRGQKKKTSRTLRDGFGNGGGGVAFRGFLFAPLGFTCDREHMGEEAESEVTWWGKTQARRGPRPGRAGPMSGRHVSPLQLTFWLWLRDGKNKMLGFCPVQFQEYFMYNFSRTQKQQK